MTESNNQAKATPIWQKITLIVVGVFFAILLVLALLSLFPNIGDNDSSERADAGRTLHVEFRLTDGDYFFHQQGRIRPPEENTLLGSYTISWDENGFRIPAMAAEHYPIAAFGDSFTEGTTVAAPWPDLLAAELDVPVQNFGYRGYGPLEIASTAESYLGDDARSWVLYAHFSGNDLMNANSSLDEDDVVRDPIGQLAWLTRQALGGEQAQVVESEDGQYDYPMPVIIGGSFYEIALLEDLLWWQIAPEEGFLGTETFNVVGDALDTVAEQAPETACRAVIFVPSKEQIYYPYIHEDVRQWLRGIARVPIVNSANRITLREQPMAEEDEPDFIASLGEQRDALRQLAAERNWMFIDLLEPFQQAALERGIAGEELLYYQYDGHWTPSGHQLATDIIANFMREHSASCPLALE